MKKKIFTVLSVLLVCGLLSGCGDGSFTMTCTSEKNESTGYEMQNVVTYNFDKDQVAKEYTVSTTQKFKDKSVYKNYKSAQEKTIKNTTDKNVTYSLKHDDNKLTLVFTMSIKNIDKSVTSESEKATLKAKTILKSNKENDVSCKLNGISEDELK